MKGSGMSSIDVGYADPIPAKQVSIHEFLGILQKQPNAEFAYISPIPGSIRCMIGKKSQSTMLVSFSKNRTYEVSLLDSSHIYSCGRTTNKISHLLPKLYPLLHGIKNYLSVDGVFDGHLYLPNIRDSRMFFSALESHTSNDPPLRYAVRDILKYPVNTLPSGKSLFLDVNGTPYSKRMLILSHIHSCMVGINDSPSRNLSVMFPRGYAKENTYYEYTPSQPHSWDILLWLKEKLKKFPHGLYFYDMDRSYCGSLSKHRSNNGVLHVKGQRIQSYRIVDVIPMGKGKRKNKGMFVLQTQTGETFRAHASCPDKVREEILAYGNNYVGLHMKVRYTATDEKGIPLNPTAQGIIGKWTEIPEKG